MTESVWDYPRPPRVEPSFRRVRVIFDGEVIAETTRALRVLETSHPPVYYIPLDDVRREYLVAGRRHSFCEFKGRADYYTIAHDGRRVGGGRLVLPDAIARLRAARRPPRLLPWPRRCLLP